MKKFLIRAASGFTFVALMVAAILWNQYSYLAIISFILVGSLLEYFKITDLKTNQPISFLQGKWPVVILSFLIFLSSFILTSAPAAAVPSLDNLFTAALQVLLSFRDAGLTMNASIPILFFILLAIELYSKSETPFENVGRKTIGVLWIVVPLILTNTIYFAKGGPFLLAIFFIIWGYDSACYVFGSLIGRTKMFERISPKKTVEGMICGALFILVAAYFLLTKIPGLESLGGIEWVILSFFIIIAATYGDLAESLLKRSLSIKDSGSIMPGHGGFLDRFDAYFFAVPVTVAVLWAITQVQNLIIVFNFLSQ